MLISIFVVSNFEINIILPLCFSHFRCPACVTKVRMGNNGLTVSDASANGVGRGNNLIGKAQAFLPWTEGNTCLEITFPQKISVQL